MKTFTAQDNKDYELVTFSNVLHYDQDENI